MNKPIKAYSFFILFLFLSSMELWITWGGNRTLMFTLFGCGALFVKMLYNIRFSFSKRNIILTILLYVSFLYSLDAKIAQIFTQIPTRLIPIICIVCIADEYKEKILYYITKWYAYIILFSLFIYIIVSFIPIPGFGNLKFTNQSSSNLDVYGTYINYILYVKNLGWTRFNGPFLEPGYVGMIGAFLLLANRFNFKKKENIIILISVLVSMSLAGWMLTLIGYILNLFYIGKIRFSRFALALLFIIALISIGQNYNNGDNIINEKILSRLEYDEEKGFSGNNRNKEGIKLLSIGIWATNAETILYGYPETAFYQFQDYELIGSGADYFLVHFGLVGVLLALSFYIYTTATAKDKKSALLFFILVLFSFWQRCYALWFSWIICFYYSTIIADRTKYIKNKPL